MRKNLLKITILSFILLLLIETKSLCADGTIRMQINNGTAWTNISVSESYEECEKLNSSTSTLGTNLLKAHLTTDADWSAMAILSVSQYGGAKENNPARTTGNASGIYAVATNNTQTTGLLETTTSSSTDYISGLFNGDGTTKEYIKKWSGDRATTGFVGFTDTYGWYGGDIAWGTYTIYPVSIRRGLFGVGIGRNFPEGQSGGRYSNVTFRPVIWN